MPDLAFQVESVQVAPYAASPQLAFKVRIRQVPEPGYPLAEIQSVALQCQVRLEPGRRRYSANEQGKLVELFGEPKRWGQTVRSTLWVNTAATARAFGDETTIDLLVPCTYDFNIAQAKYFHALDDGDVPLCLLFSGTIFYAGADGGLQIEQISWDKEATFRMPVAVWKQMMEMYYPNATWLALRRDVFDGLYRLKVERGFTSWEQTIESLLTMAQAAGANP